MDQRMDQMDQMDERGEPCHRQRSVVNAEHVYTATMRRLEQHHGVLEVLGAPIVGSELRAAAGGGVGGETNRRRSNKRERTAPHTFTF